MKNVLVPEGARCCTDHFVNNQLKTDAIDMIKPSSVQGMRFTAGDVQLLIGGWQMIFQQQKRFNFDSIGYLSEDDCETMIGQSKIQFEDLIQHFSSSSLRDSSNRSVRTAIAILLCKLRLGISNRLLATLFQLPNQRVVSRCLESARRAMMDHFVSRCLGFEHISRDQVLKNHASEIAQYILSDDDPQTAVVVIDGTYLHIQVRWLFELSMKNLWASLTEIAQQRIPAEVV